MAWTGVVLVSEDESPVLAGDGDGGGDVVETATETFVSTWVTVAFVVDGDGGDSIVETATETFVPTWATVVLVADDNAAGVVETATEGRTETAGGS